MAEAQDVQDWLTRYEQLRGLARQLEQGTIPHALLLTGPPSVAGDLAYELSTMILCQGTDRPCGHCVSCREMASGVHPDYYRIQSMDTARVKTADIGNLQAWLTVRPHYGQRKVYVIDGIDHATPVAANRLLKTLEEPTQSVIAILTASYRSLVLPTIRSRCFHYALQSGSNAVWRDTNTFELLEKKFHENQEGLFAGFLTQMVQWTEAWFIKDQSSLVLADRWMNLSEGMAPSDALLILSAWLRDLMHVCLGETSQLHFTELLPQMNQIAPHLSATQWTDAISLVIRTRLRVGAHVALLLNIEQMCIRLWEVMRRV